jgi:hypothetical protein
MQEYYQPQPICMSEKDPTPGTLISEYIYSIVKERCMHMHSMNPYSGTANQTPKGANHHPHNKKKLYTGCTIGKHASQLLLSTHLIINRHIFQL